MSTITTAPTPRPTWRDVNIAPLRYRVEASVLDPTRWVAYGPAASTPASPADVDFHMFPSWIEALTYARRRIAQLMMMNDFLDGEPTC